MIICPPVLTLMSINPKKVVFQGKTTLCFSVDSNPVFSFHYFMSDIKRKAVVIGVTGGIACGKSEMGRILGGMGFVVSDADRIAHELMAKGTPVYRNIVDCFGATVLAEDGEISRPRLGRIVFENPGQLLQLNQLVHPAVREVLKRWIAERRANSENAAVQIPLMFESGMNDLDWDAIICVSCVEAQVYERLEKRGIDRPAARSRIASQMPLEEKEDLSDYVIDNSGTLGDLEKATRVAVESLMVER